MAPLPKRKFSTRRSGKREAARTEKLKVTLNCKECGKQKISHRLCPNCGK